MIQHNQLAVKHAEKSKSIYQKNLLNFKYHRFIDLPTNCEKSSKPTK